MLGFGASSKLNSEWAFLTHLRDIGRVAADRWLRKHFDDIETRSSLDLREIFGEVDTPVDENVLTLRQPGTA